MKVVLEKAIVCKGTNKDGKSYYYVEVQETVRKYINHNQARDLAVLDDLATNSVVLDELVLNLRNNSLVFSTEQQPNSLV